MKTWAHISHREKLRVKGDPKRFQELWAAQIGNCQYAACAQMLESAICAIKAHARVPITEVAARTGLSLAEIARLLHERGGVSGEKLSASCPDQDPLKQELLSELQTREAQAALEQQELLRQTRALKEFKAASAVSMEHVRPWVFSLGFINQVANADRHWDPRKRQTYMNRERYAFEQLGRTETLKKPKTKFTCNEME